MRASLVGPTRDMPSSCLSHGAAILTEEREYELSESRSQRVEKGLQKGERSKKITRAASLFNGGSLAEHRVALCCEPEEHSGVGVEVERGNHCK